ncbi:MAG: hypothetical protein KBT82_17630 [Marinobacter sp.]|uniref:Wadjet anti-phage system protein JetD domain-containing protein n=1 Tax=Marinobacter sp. TaxID=50741 RepID=UPI001B56C22B|nr:Wadjet anti-phage system protein JetD domain-containing protein [Marinobacter sp.]MBQ0748507.1 hypothetical protein [Marinobacter sp.]MBQ0815967.1 hypothetical protein [Marinobacter sp.]
MSNHVETFLAQLIKHIDKPDGAVPQARVRITDHAYRWYFALNNSAKIALHQSLEGLSDLDIEYQRRVALGAFKHIEAVHITDGRRLMASQGLTPLVDDIQLAFERLEAAEFNVPWWGATKRDVAEAWSANKTFNGVKRQQSDRLFDAMKVVEWIVQSADASPVPDMRTLSTMLFYDSKKLEEKSFANLIRRLMLGQLDDDVANLMDDGPKLLEYFGISKYPMPMRFKACAQLVCRGVVDLSALHYGIGVSPDEVKGIEWRQRPPYLLFIENRASFERYVREIDDTGVVIYTAGFPPRSWVHAIEIIIAEIRGEVPVYHWGDRDVGGYRILAFLAKRLDIDIQPYLMGVDAPVPTQDHDEFEEKPVVGLMQAIESARGYPAISALYEDLGKFQRPSLPWIEQEQIAPISPLEKNERA